MFESLTTEWLSSHPEDEFARIQSSLQFVRDNISVALPLLSHRVGSGVAAGGVGGTISGSGGMTGALSGNKSPIEGNASGGALVLSNGSGRENEGEGGSLKQRKGDGSSIHQNEAERMEGEILADLPKLHGYFLFSFLSASPYLLFLSLPFFLSSSLSILSRIYSFQAMDLSKIQSDLYPMPFFIPENQLILSLLACECDQWEKGILRLMEWRRVKESG